MKYKGDQNSHTEFKGLSFLENLKEDILAKIKIWYSENDL